MLEHSVHNCRRIIKLLLVWLCGLWLTACSPLSTANHSPVALSLTAIPNTMGPADSTTVFCDARDQDGDPIVFDWITDARLNIKGVPTYQFSVYNRHSPYQVFYVGPASTHQVDTAWVQCFVRDGVGGVSRGITVDIIIRRRM